GEVHLPDAYAAVPSPVQPLALTHGSKPPAVRTKGHFGHGPRVAVQHRHLLQPRRPPEPNRAVRARRGDPLAVRAVSRGEGLSAMVVERTLHRPARCRIPLADRAVGRGRDQAATIPAECRAKDFAGVPPTFRHLRPGPDVPQASQTFFPCRGDPCAVRAEDQDIHPVLVPEAGSRAQSLGPFIEGDAVPPFLEHGHGQPRTIGVELCTAIPVTLREMQTSTYASELVPQTQPAVGEPLREPGTRTYVP